MNRRHSTRIPAVLAIAAAMTLLAGCATTERGTQAGAATASPGAVGENHEALIEAVGPHLVDAEGEQVPSRVLAENKYVVLYFSAGWCPPCRAYTPRLVEFHEAHADSGVEVIFVSSDREAEAMAGYMADYDMPWLAVPYDRIDDSGIKSKYGGRTIPRVVVLDGAGQVVMNSDQVNRNEIPDRVAQMLR